MRSRVLAVAGSLALALGGLVLVPAAPALADSSHCTGWTTHPDVYGSGGVSFGNGTNIRTGPFTDCTSLGEGFPSQGIDVHCGIDNVNGNIWFYVEDTSTGKQGWARDTALHYSKSVAIRDCYYVNVFYLEG